MSEKLIKQREYKEDGHLAKIANPVIRQLLAQRGIESVDDLDYRAKGLLHFNQFKDMDKAAVLLADAVINKEKIVIGGDYDCDGCTATSIMVRGLRLCGVKEADHGFCIPDRFEHGYGLSEPFVEYIVQQHPDASLLVTVDSGISNIAGVAKAKEAGLKVVITDHHLCGDEIPDADAIINPQQEDCPFPSKAVAGCGVAWYVICALVAELDKRDHFGAQRPKPGVLLDIVALGTIADLVKLDKNNRILVDLGLRRMRAGYACEGIKALAGVAGKATSELTEVDMGFALGPRINAVGRLKDMSVGVQTLITDDPVEAQSLACDLDAINVARKERQADMQTQALRILEQAKERVGKVSAGVVVYGSDWHEGIIGIVAGQVKEVTYRPTIVFSDAEDGLIKGSGRSIEALHMRDILDKIDRQHPGIIVKFGGHAMACGLSIKKDKLDEFTALFEQFVDDELTEDDYKNVIVSDGQLRASDFTIEFINELGQYGPFGQGFTSPVFDGEFEVVQAKVLKEKHLKLKLRVPYANKAIDAIAFNVEDVMEQWSECPHGTVVKTAFTLSINKWKDYVNPQLMVQHVEKVG